MNRATCVSPGLWPARRSQLWRILLLIALPLACAGLLLISCRNKPGDSKVAALPTVAGAAAPAGGGSAPAAILEMPAGIDLMKQPGTRYNVTYAPDVVHVSAATVKRYLIGVNRDHDIYVFNDSPELREKLKPGNVVLLEGVNVKTILAIANDGPHLIVGTEQAPLSRLFKNADIRWHTPVNFLEIHNRQAQALAGRNAARMRNPVLSWLSPRPVFAGTEAKEEEEEGWHIKHEMDFSPDKVDFQVDLTRVGSTLDANITGKGYVQNFESSLALTVNNGQVDRFDFSNHNVNGIIDFNWTIGSPGKPPELGEEKLKLPALMSVPFYLGPMPFTLELGEALLFHPAFSAKEEIAKGAFHVDYNGVTGLSVTRGSNGQPEQQNTSNASSDSAIQTSTAFSPLAAFGVVVAAAIPRFELKTGAEEFLPEIPESLADRAAQLLENTTIGHFVKKAREQLKTEAAGTFQVVISSTASHSGMLSLVPCQRFMLHVEGQVSADATVLGIPKELLKTTTIFQKDIDQPTPNAKICTG